MGSILLSNGLKMPMEGFGVCNFYPHVLADFCETVEVIPKSTHKERMEQNMDVGDFALSDADMAEIARFRGGVDAKDVEKWGDSMELRAPW